MPKNKSLSGRIEQGWAVVCNRKDQPLFLTAHWDKEGARRQLEDIRKHILKEGCRHRIIRVEVRILPRKKKSK